MKVKLIHKSGYHSKIENQNGNSIEIDNKSDLSPKGVSPMELLLMGVAGCSSIDIISILISNIIAYLRVSFYACKTISNIGFRTTI